MAPPDPGLAGLVYSALRARRVLRHRYVIASAPPHLTAARICRKMREPARLLIVHGRCSRVRVARRRMNGTSLSHPPRGPVLTTLRFLGREPVLVAGDRPGLVANRLTAAVLREALDLIAKGAIRAVDLDRLVARGIGLGWAVRGPLATEIIGAQLEAPEGLPRALDATLAPLWSTLASWGALDATARAGVEHELRSSLGEMQKANAAGRGLGQNTSRVAPPRKPASWPVPWRPRPPFPGVPPATRRVYTKAHQTATPRRMRNTPTHLDDSGGEAPTQ